ncbi:SH3 domain-containing protein [Cavenderia fasciculata]|uniref:SH3 domain-containing protein n=1 Tax=Cavenderia fasciculata TaxID=261658 RepID=F4PLX5_CACFS|nr:SH3 domain-containing protein [Cavenderia fasciculata]EGG23529.1 SH3 domain-containing protein [Cavenderia fasciculata]|eukprot:XP_004361380.1 SH3 domain-containing protein [Cavenderia fasciculata]
MSVPLYTWHQNNSTVVIKFDVPAAVTKQDILSEITGSSIKFGVKGFAPHLDGQLANAIKGSRWTLKEDVGQIQILLDKSTQSIPWNNLITSFSSSSPFVSRARVMYEYSATNEEELSLLPYEVIGIFASDDSGWLEGERLGVKGAIPSNFVEIFQNDYQPLEDVEASAEFAKTEDNKPGKNNNESIKHHHHHHHHCYSLEF